MTSPNPERQPVTGSRRAIVIFLDRMILGFARTWALWAALLMGLYAGIPFAAPMAMNAGMTGVANTIYSVYSPMCHQFAFRSWFLGGEQTVYPRERANVEGVDSFESYAIDEPFFEGVDVNILDEDLVFRAKAFKGSERMGFKVAFCERDVAIYAAIALFAVVFAILRRTPFQVPPLPFWLYVLIAIVPIGLDGFSQLFANPPMNGFGLDFYPIRESTPFLRVFTGALFGLGNAWLAFPYIEESLNETKELLEEKLSKAGVITISGE